MGTPHTHPDRPTTQHPTPSLQKLHHGGKAKEIAQLEQIEAEEDRDQQFWFQVYHRHGSTTFLVQSLP